LRDGSRKYLCDSFQQVIDTLKNTDDEQDFPWQAQLLLYVSLEFFNRKEKLICIY